MAPIDQRSPAKYSVWTIACLTGPSCAVCVQNWTCSYSWMKLKRCKISKFSSVVDLMTSIFWIVAFRLIAALQRWTCCANAVGGHFKRRYDIGNGYSRICLRCTAGRMQSIYRKARLDQTIAAPPPGRSAQRCATSPAPTSAGQAAT